MSKSSIYAAISGLVFGLGLAISGMTEPTKVLAFLDLAGDWDPSLALVMLAALAVALPGFHWLKRKRVTVCGDEMQWPESRSIDARLVLGAAMFGVGWGLAGYCPGPALANLARLDPQLAFFLPSMLAGGWIAGRVAR